MDFKGPIKYFWAIVFFGWAIVILISSMIPTTGIEPKSDNESGLRLDYLIHLFVFIVLSLLFGFWRRDIAAIQKKKEILRFLAGGTVYAGLTEGVQLFIDGRSFNPIDLFFNVLGILAGTLLAWLLIIKPASKNKNR
jgi:VanZ family protein